MTYYVVEHPTRGVYMGMQDQNRAEAKPKFSHTKSRAQCKRFTMLEEAQIRAVWSGMPPKCFVVEMPGGKIIPVELGPVQKQGHGKPPAKRAREAALRKAMVVCLRELSEEAVIDILTDNWTTLDRCDALKARFP